MATVTVSQQIAAPVDEVFRVFTDIARTSEHVAGIATVTVMTPGPVGLGSRWVETRKVMGRLDSAEMEITAYERNRMYTITHHKAGVRIDTTFWFEPHRSGTAVSIEFELDSAGLPTSLLPPLGWAIAAKVEQVLKQDLSDLTRLVE